MLFMCFQIGLAGGAGIQHSLDKGFLGEGLQGARLHSRTVEALSATVCRSASVSWICVQSHGQPHGGG